MISRHSLREKVLQTVYAFVQSEDNRLDIAEKNMQHELHKLYELYITLFSVIVELADYAQERMDEAKQKHFPTPEELNPNMRFVNNPVIDLIRNNPVYILKTAEFKINWKNEKEIFRNIYQSLIKSEFYLNYMEAETTDFQTDLSFISNLLRKRLSNNSLLFYYFEERNMHWAGDFENVVFWTYKSVKSIEEDKENFILTEDLFLEEEDKNFAVELLRRTVMNLDKTEEMVKSKVENWEVERVALLDLLVMKMAVTEFLDFPTIPLKVTINEYIDVAKVFGSEKSSSFVNGLLNRIQDDLKAEGKIKKTGRGLIEN